MTNNVSALMERIRNPFMVNVPDTPTCYAPRGIRYDFNDGARILFPKGKWHVILEDDDTGNILFDKDVDDGWVLSRKKYYIKFKIRIWDREEEKPFFEEVMDLNKKPVLIKIPIGTLGDVIAWMTYVDRFQKKHNCLLNVTMQERMVELFKEQYPNIFFSPMPGKELFDTPYASYRVGLFFNGDVDNQPVDFRTIGLHTTAAYILGVDTAEEPPKVKLGSKRKIKERYVCIACKGSSQNKYWNNSEGWEEVIAYLKSIGYRVLCIDREKVHGQCYVWNRMPFGCEDFTGNIPLQERVELLEHADFFVGLGSGLTWLAWCCHIPIVMISGFSLPFCEFYTKYRVFNPQGCNGCWNDVNVKFERDFFWCPRQQGTKRMFECTRLISGKLVISHIKQLMKDNNLSLPKEDIAKS